MKPALRASSAFQEKKVCSTMQFPGLLQCRPFRVPGAGALASPENPLFPPIFESLFASHFNKSPNGLHNLTAFSASSYGPFLEREASQSRRSSTGSTGSNIGTLLIFFSRSPCSSTASRSLYCSRKIVLPIGLGS